MKLTVISGARPQFIKLSPLLQEFDNQNYDFNLIHTGQHYDFEMSEIFFRELGIRKPDINLNVGSNSHAIQTADIMIKLDPILTIKDTKAVLIPGDTNTTIAAALTAVKKNIPVIHHEAGLRSYDRKMPEEINRIVTDHCSELLLAPTITAKDILLSEGIDKNKIFVTGDTMLDNFLNTYEKIHNQDTSSISKMQLPEKYGLLTLHRQENTNDLNKLKRILIGIEKLSQRIPIVFPMHPRTKKIIEENNLTKFLNKTSIRILKPLGYIDFMKIASKSTMVITDSGGLQKESAFLGKPCVTLRDSTEWVETIKNSWNILVKNSYEDLDRLYDKINNMNINQKEVWKFYGNGNASKIIYEIIKKFY